MGKITNVDGSTIQSDEAVRNLAKDPKLLKLLDCASCSDLKSVWLSREADREDIQVALLMQLVGDIQHLGNAIGVLLNKLEFLTTQSNTRN